VRLIKKPEQGNDKVKLVGNCRPISTEIESEGTSLS